MRREIRSSIPADNDILLGIKNGSKDSLDQLYRHYFPMALQLILKNNGTEDDAKDIFQEAVIVLYNKVSRGGFELSSKLNTFLYAVCRRLWLKRLNQQSRHSGNIAELGEVLEVEDDLAAYEEQDLKFKQMDTALGMLGEPCRTIIEDFYMNNQTMQDICKKFGYTNADNAKTQKYKCLQRLKKLFFQTGGK